MTIALILAAHLFVAALVATQDLAKAIAMLFALALRGLVFGLYYFVFGLVILIAAPIMSIASLVKKKRE